MMNSERYYRSMKTDKDDLPLKQVAVQKLDVNLEVDLERALELCGKENDSSST